MGFTDSRFWPESKKNPKYPKEKQLKIEIEKTSKILPIGRFLDIEISSKKNIPPITPPVKDRPGK